MLATPKQIEAGQALPCPASSDHAHPRRTEPGPTLPLSIKAHIETYDLESPVAGPKITEPDQPASGRDCLVEHLGRNVLGQIAEDLHLDLPSSLHRWAAPGNAIALDGDSALVHVVPFNTAERRQWRQAHDAGLE